MPLTVHARALQRAAEILGGKERLRAHLGASMRDVEAWLSGAERAPTDVFLMAVDVIASNRASAADIRETILARPGPAMRPSDHAGTTPRPPVGSGAGEPPLAGGREWHVP